MKVFDERKTDFLFSLFLSSSIVMQFKKFKFIHTQPSTPGKS